MRIFLRCVGEAVVEQGIRGLAGMVPGGEFVWEVAKKAWEKYRLRCPKPEARSAEILELATTEYPAALVVGEQVALDVAPAASAEELKNLASLVSLVPAAVRSSLKSKDDPKGRSLPRNGLVLLSPNDVLKLMPAGTLLFRQGDLVPDTVDWKLERPLGVGGFGEVWLARHVRLKSMVGAVKFCRLPEQQKRSLEHEGEVIAQVMAARHPGIVPLHDVRLDCKWPWLRYEYVEGGDLTDWILHLQTLSQKDRECQVLETLRQLAETMGHFHGLSRAVVHRDLKPANILVDAQRRQPRITDFGIGAVMAEATLAAEGRGESRHGGRSLQSFLLGAHTPLYASQQQREGHPPDPRDDVHALGVIAYQMLSGQVVSGTDGDWEVDLREVGVDEELVRLIQACVSRKVERRPRDGNAVLERLQVLGVPQAAKPTGAPAKVAQVPAVVARTEPAREIVNSIGMKLMRIPAGTFVMGSPDNEVGRDPNEGPQHEVEISKAFYLGAFQVTQAEYHRVMGKNPSWFSVTGSGKDKVKGWFSSLDTSNFPVESVSWDDAVEFCRKLSEMPEERKHGRMYRLPTEAEWEYACRGGPFSSPYQVFHFGNSLSSTQANFDGNCPYGGAATGPYLERTCAVGSYPANKLGLHDMHGNVYEWCSDWYAADFYARSPRRDPSGPPISPQVAVRVRRGGSWNSFRLIWWSYRSASRSEISHLPEIPPSGIISNLFNLCFTPLDWVCSLGDTSEPSQPKSDIGISSEISYDIGFRVAAVLSSE